MFPLNVRRQSALMQSIRSGMEEGRYDSHPAAREYMQNLYGSWHIASLLGRTDYNVIRVW